MTRFTMEPETEPTAEQRVLNNEALIKQQGVLINELSNGLNEVLTLLRANPVMNVPTPPTPIQQDQIQVQDQGHAAVKRAIPRPILPPSFTGRNDPNGYLVWCFKLEKYLAHYPDLNPLEQVNLTASFLKGPALTWYMHHEKHINKFDSLHDLLTNLESTCNLTDDVNKAEDAFFALRQTNSVGEYITAFEDARLKVTDIQDGEAVRRFVGGLKPALKAAIRREEARKGKKLNLKQAQDLASVEDPVGLQKPRSNPNPGPAPTRDGDDMMDLDAVVEHGRLCPLTKAQRDYLMKNNGCFACRRLGHRSGDPICIRNRKKAPQDNAAVEEIHGVDESDSSGYDGVNLDTGLKISSSSKTSYSAIKSLSRSISKVHDSDDWQLNPTTSQDIFDRWGVPKIDLFASCRNKQAHFYFRKKIDPQDGSSVAMG